MSIKGKAESYIQLRGSLSMPDMIVGKSAYEVAVASGFDGTEEEWLLSLKGDKGDKGENGVDGTVAFDDLTDAQRASLKGEKGDKGDKGDPGDRGEKGDSYALTDEDIKKIATEVAKGITIVPTTAKIGSVTILASKWVGAASPYSQVVAVEGATENSQVDLTPSVEQLAIFHQKDLAFVTENEGGVVTVYAIGQKPENDYTIQVTITEVAE